MRKIVSANAFRAGWAACERAYIGLGTLFAQARQDSTHCIWPARHWSEEAMKEHEAARLNNGWGEAAAQLEALAKTL